MSKRERWNFFVADSLVLIRRKYVEERVKRYEAGKYKEARERESVWGFGESKRTGREQVIRDASSSNVPIDPPRVRKAVDFCPPAREIVRSYRHARWLGARVELRNQASTNISMNDVPVVEQRVASSRLNPAAYIAKSNYGPIMARSWRIRVFVVDWSSLADEADSPWSCASSAARKYTPAKKHLPLPSIKHRGTAGQANIALGRSFCSSMREETLRRWGIEIIGHYSCEY